MNHGCWPLSLYSRPLIVPNCLASLIRVSDIESSRSFSQTASCSPTRQTPCSPVTISHHCGSWQRSLLTSHLNVACDWGPARQLWLKVARLLGMVLAKKKPQNSGLGKGLINDAFGDSGKGETRWEQDESRAMVCDAAHKLLTLG